LTNSRIFFGLLKTTNSEQKSASVYKKRYFSKTFISKRRQERIYTIPRGKNMRKKAEMGMGTLIIFIAMILVAAVAAGVLISTTETLQNKALATGKATSTEVGTSMTVVQVYAEDGTNQNLEEFIEVIKLSSGSEPIRFTDLLLTMSLDNTSADYQYNTSYDCAESLLQTNTSWTNITQAGVDYGISYSITGPNNKSGYLTKGDVVKLCFEAPRSVSESEEISISLIPKVGTVRKVETSLPDLMVDKRIDLFP
jgi:archaeal flagellin FlaB